MRFHHDTRFEVGDFLPGREEEASEGLKALVARLNEKISSGETFDLWTRTYLAVEYRIDDEVRDTLTDEERDLVFEYVPTKQIDTRASGWKAMEKLGVVKAVVEFHGGNDEGYCEGITIHYGDGTRESISEYPKEEDETKAILADLLTIPVYDRYGSFAGDFSVQGYLIWDYATKEVRIDGSEQVWEGFEETV